MMKIEIEADMSGLDFYTVTGTGRVRFMVTPQPGESPHAAALRTLAERIAVREDHGGDDAASG